MGNDYNCCNGQQQQLENDVQIIKTPKISDHRMEQHLDNVVFLDEAPVINENIAEAILCERIFASENEDLKKRRIIKRENGSVYQGPIDQRNRPNGYGKMYQTDEILSAGLFQHGNKIGEHYLFLPDGSFYKGIVQNGQISKGIYKSQESFTYQGPFQDYQFHGRGKEHHKDYEFSGEYLQGKRVQGQLRWKEKNVVNSYIGRFDDQGRFEGFGVLSTREGVFKGDFKAGIKNGRGVMEFTNGLTYEGFYQNGEKNGNGKIINSNRTLCYQGEFKDGLPHGWGKSYDEKGRQKQGEFKCGIASIYYQRISQASLMRRMSNY